MPAQSECLGPFERVFATTYPQRKLPPNVWSEAPDSINIPWYSPRSAIYLLHIFGGPLTPGHVQVKRR